MAIDSRPTFSDKPVVAADAIDRVFAEFGLPLAN